MLRLVLVVGALSRRNLTDEREGEERKHRDGHTVAFQPARIFFFLLAGFFVLALVALHVSLRSPWNARKSKLHSAHRYSPLGSLYGMRHQLPASATGYFGSMAESYDSLIHRAVPRYDEMIARLLDYLPVDAQQVLELGSGTGNLSLRLADTFPRGRLTLVDGSPEMVELVRSRIATSTSDA